MTSTPSSVVIVPSNDSFVAGTTVGGNIGPINGSEMVWSQSSPLFPFLHQTLMCTVFVCTVVDLCTLFVTGFGTHFIRRTKILHPNLRLVLSVQCLLVGLWALTDIATNVCKIWANSPETVGPPWLAALYTFTLQFVNFIGHVLLLERVMATIWVSRYENCTGPCFSLAWIALLTTVCGTNALFYYLAMVSAGSPSINAFSLIISYVLLALSFVEILVIAKLGLYNASKFTQSAFYQKNVRLNSLSERYQLSENVRTLKQLGPTFIAHFFGVLFLNITLNVCFFVPVETFLCSNRDPIVMLVVLFVSFVNLAMVIAIIEFHPALRAKWRRMFRRLFFCLPLFICCAKKFQNKDKTEAEGAKGNALVVAISMNSRPDSIGGAGTNGSSAITNNNKPSPDFVNNNAQSMREGVQQRRKGSPTLVFPSSQLAADNNNKDVEKVRHTQQHFEMLRNAWA